MAGSLACFEGIWSLEILQVPGLDQWLGVGTRHRTHITRNHRIVVASFGFPTLRGHRLREAASPKILRVRSQNLIPVKRVGFFSSAFCECETAKKSSAVVSAGGDNTRAAANAGEKAKSGMPQSSRRRPCALWREGGGLPPRSQPVAAAACWSSHASRRSHRFTLQAAPMK
jgi:hypothetical protein